MHIVERKRPEALVHVPRLLGGFRDAVAVQQPTADLQEAIAAGAGRRVSGEDLQEAIAAGAGRGVSGEPQGFARPRTREGRAQTTQGLG
eukprot:351257-Chlamydomonas_euryale.AAC.8